MDRDFLNNQLEKLEQSIRLLGKNSNSLLLEPVDPNVLSDIGELQEHYLVNDAKSPVPESIRATLSETVERVEKTQPTIQIEKADSTETKPQDVLPKNLDPLSATNLDSLKLRIRNCERCQLCQHRSTIVYGQGNHKADLVFIGEGPGEEEDRTGLAFVGKAGKLLTQMIHSIGLNREAVYICNIVKCRPPGNRNPEQEEIKSCSPFLFKQLELLKPKLLVSLGNVATKTLIPNAAGIMRMRGKITSFQGIPLIPTFHPSYLLRNQKALADVWNDMRQIRQTLYKQMSTD